MTVSDSAGIEIITNARTFLEVPSRALPQDFEREIVDDALYQIEVLRPLADGTLAVGVGGSGAVFLYDAAGSQVGELGRAGDGPGEFRSVQSLVPLRGDSLGVYDPQLRRLTVFPLHGGDPRVLSLATVAPDRGWSRVHPLPSSLVFVGEAGLGGAEQRGVYRNTATSYRVDLAGEIVATYGDFPGLEAFAGSGMMGRAPFGALLATATVGEQLIVGTGARPELRFFGPEGQVSRIVRWADQDRAVTEDRFDAFVQFLLSQSPPEQAAAMRQQMQGMPHASQVPTHSEIMASPDGRIWVGEYPGPEAELPPGHRLRPRRWVVFGADGSIEERIETPVGFMPFALTKDHVWGVYFDELDVESVRAYVFRLDGK